MKNIFVRLNYKLLVMLWSSLTFIGCDTELKKYYPAGSVKLLNGEIKSFYSFNEIYVDNSNIDDFELEFIYNIMDTVIDYKNKDKKKIYVVDTLKFRISDNDIISLNNKYLNPRSYDIFVDRIGINSKIRVYNGENIRILLKKDGQLLESYLADFICEYVDGERTDYQYIINPLGKSRFMLSSVQYGGFMDFKKTKPIIYSDNFITLLGPKIDFFLVTPPDTITYQEIKVGNLSFDPCMAGCEKTTLTKIK